MAICKGGNMGQKKFYINYNWKSFLFGWNYEKGLCFEIKLTFFTFGIGLTDSAKGFGIWRA
jgi:hypothetical protein